MFSKIAVDVKDVTSVVDVTMRDTVLFAMVELDVNWTLPTYRKIKFVTCFLSLSLQTLPSQLPLYTIFTSIFD